MYRNIWDLHYKDLVGSIARVVYCLCRMIKN